MPLFKNLNEFYNQYQMPLARALHHIERRGVMVDADRLASLANDIALALRDEVEKIEQASGRRVVIYAFAKDKADKDCLCLNSPKDVITLLKHCGLKVPTNRATHHETSNEVALQRIFADSGHAVPKAMLAVRELTKLKGTYVDALSLNNILYTSYLSIGTVSGRRSSRSAWNGLGTNHQNLPKHSKLGLRYRECIVARPGKIFVSCDQKGAEDWAVQGIIVDNGGSSNGLEELRAGINRHRKLAARLFGRPEAESSKTTGDPPGLWYDLGKRTRHAGQYGMRGNRMSETYAKEGKHLPAQVCDALIVQFHSIEPDIQNKFQAYVEETLLRTRCLSTPIGRVRQSLSIRPYSDNSTVFREFYSYIPQSTVGDNTGLAIIYCEREAPGLVVLDAHDALTLEVVDDLQTVQGAIDLLQNAFDRTLTFPNGTEIKIPVEFELGYDMKNTVQFDRPDQTEKFYNRAKALKQTVDSSVC